MIAFGAGELRSIMRADAREHSNIEDYKDYDDYRDYYSNWKGQSRKSLELHPY